MEDKTKEKNTRATTTQKTDRERKRKEIAYHQLVPVDVDGTHNGKLRGIAAGRRIDRHEHVLHVLVVEVESVRFGQNGDSRRVERRSRVDVRLHAPNLTKIRSVRNRKIAKVAKVKMHHVGFFFA